MSRRHISYNIIRCILPLVIMLLSFSSCIKGEDWGNGNAPMDNFKALWTIIDEHYCFFDYKAKAIGLDWNNVYKKYEVRISEKMDSKQLFEVLGEMLSELQDGHVNLYASFDIARNWSWREDFPSNFNDSIQQLYLGKDYKIASGLKYKILPDNIGYIYYASFGNGIGDGNLSEVLNNLSTCDGIILDVRNNTGGNLSYAERLAARFTNEKILVGYICHKTGTGHNDFSKPEEVWLEPSDGVRWQKNAVVLTNRSCYSATNDFIKSVKRCPNVTIIGDRTGGGSGLPFSSEIPNGWSIRFSACPMYDADMQQTEFGIDPDIKVSQKKEDILKDKDTLIEFAREFLKK